MSRYLIDGYNLLFASDLSTLPLEEGRERLIELLVRFAKQFETEVVFDGKEISIAHRRDLKILFSPHADQMILDELRLKRFPGEWYVVSKDNAIKAAAKELKAHSLSPALFLAKAQIVTRKKKSPSLPDHEMERWLEIFESRLKNME